MAKTLNGIVTSTKMRDTIVIEVSRRTPHPLYKKLLARSKKFKAATNGMQVAEGDYVQISESTPMAKGKHFVLSQVIRRVKEEKHA